MPETDNTQLEIHIGYVYGRKEPPAHASKFTPKFVPGARLPHAWIRMKNSPDLPAIDVSYVKEFSPHEVAARRYSTLDLCPFDKFTLLVGSRTAWTERFKDLEGSVRGHGVGLCISVAGEDFDFVDQKYAEHFADEADMSTGGGLLIRPDQHILRILRTDDKAEELHAAILAHLGT